MIQTKKGQVGIIAAIFLFGMFLLMWFIWLGRWIAESGQMAVQNNNLVGVEAFFFNNFNFIIMIVVILAMMGWMYFAGN